jgi:hypothetical protein
MNNARPTLPLSPRIVLGVAKIPVPITRLKIKNAALTTPIWRRSSGVVSKMFPSSVAISQHKHQQHEMGEKTYKVE